MRLSSTAVAAAVLLAALPAAASDWDLDPSHTAAQFAVKHMMVSTVRGEFQKVAGTLKLDEKDITKSALEVVIEAKSINTRDAKRDEHLNSPDFFDTAKFPQVKFKSTKIEKDGAGLKITGDLTMHGVTRPVTLTAGALSEARPNPWGMTIRGISATGKLNRKDWGLTWNKALEVGGGLLVGEEVELTIDAELVAKAPAKAAAK